MTRWLVLLLSLAACETDDFFITDGSDDCPPDTGETGTETDADAAPTTSAVMSEPLAEITTVPASTRPETTGPEAPPDPTLPAFTPAQEPS